MYTQLWHESRPACLAKHVKLNPEIKFSHLFVLPLFRPLNNEPTDEARLFIKVTVRHRSNPVACCISLLNIRDSASVITCQKCPSVKPEGKELWKTC